MNAPWHLHDLGQSLWLDNITRALPTSSMMQRQSAVGPNPNWDFSPSLTGSRRAAAAATTAHRRLVSPPK